MTEQNELHQLENKFTISHLLHMAKKGVAALFGLALVGSGLIGTALAFLNGFIGRPYWTIGLSAVSLALVYPGGKLLLNLRRGESEPVLKQREEGDRGRKHDEEKAGAVSTDDTGRFVLVRGLEAAVPWIGKGLIVWYVLLPLLMAGTVLTLIGLGFTIKGVAESNTPDAVLGGGITVLGGGLLFAGGRTIYGFFRSDREEEEGQDDTETSGVHSP